MLELDFDYAGCVKNSEKVCWKIDDVMPLGTRLDFGRTFLPEGLAQTWSIECLKNYQKLKLNQISANAYLNLFAFVEEFILATMVQHAQTEMFGESGSIRALIRVAEEEAKHQELFRRYREAFDRDFGHPCGVLDCATAVAKIVLSKSPMGVMMVILHIELFTQQHYLESVRDNAEVDPFFSSLLKNHFLEEAQHARVDALELDKLARAATPAQITTAFDDYLAILAAFDGLLAQQAELDVKSLEAASGVSFSPADAKTIIEAQRRAYRKTFLTSGMVNKQFLAYLGQISPMGQGRVKTATTLYDGSVPFASSPRPASSSSSSSSASSSSSSRSTSSSGRATQPVVAIPVVDTEIDTGDPQTTPARPAARPSSPPPSTPAPSPMSARPLPPVSVVAPLTLENVAPVAVRIPQQPRAPGARSAADQLPNTVHTGDDDVTLDRGLSLPSASASLIADGALVIDVPAGAVVFVNGVEHGRGPQRVEGLDREAKLVVRVVCAGHAPWSGAVSLEGKPVAKIRPPLKPARPAP